MKMMTKYFKVATSSMIATLSTVLTARANDEVSGGINSSTIVTGTEAQ